MPKTRPTEAAAAYASAVRHARATVGDVAAALKNEIEPELYLRYQNAEAAGEAPPKLRVVLEGGELKIIDTGPDAVGHHDHPAISQ